MMTFTHQIGPDVRLHFSGKPSERVRSALKASGFRWSPAGGFWWRNRVSGAADFIGALRIMLDREAGIRRPDGDCWVCQSPEGFFRAEGAATPVRCDACQAVVVYWQNLSAGERDKWKAAAQTTELTAPQLAYTNRPQTRPTVDRFDLDYEDSCKAACGL